MLDYQALSVTNESHAFILTSRLNGWCPRFFVVVVVVVVLVLFYLFIYLFNNLAIEVTVQTRKTY